MYYSNLEMETALNSYIETALWSSYDIRDGVEIYLDTEYDKDDISDETLAVMKQDVISFITDNRHLLSDDDKNKSLDYMAHNFWLTRNGHGAGFWDGDYINGELLTDASEKYGEINLYIGDDNKIYSMQ